MPGNNTRFTLPDWIYNLSFEEALKLLLFGAFGSTAPTGTGVPTTGGGGETQNVNLTQVGGAAVALGQAAMAASLPVVIASNQTGIPVTPPTVSGVQVVGVQEVDSSSTITSPTGKVINPGGLSWAFFPSSDFVGTLKFGTGSALAWTGTLGPASRDAQSGNTLPGATITCSAGSYMVVEGRPA